MFLQSYIYRATQTLQWLTGTSCSLELLCEQQHVDTYSVLCTGLDDLIQCLHSYCGMTCRGSYLLDISSNRVAAEHVIDLCANVKRALGQGFSVHDALARSADGKVSTYLRTMERAHWDDWHDAKAMHYRSNYCTRYSDRAFQPDKSRLALKCIAKYTSIEGMALYSTLEHARCEGQGLDYDRTSHKCQVKWHDLCDITIPYSKQTVPYICIFETDDLGDYRMAVLNYWIYLLSTAGQEAERGM